EKNLYRYLKEWLGDLSQREVSEGIKSGFKALEYYKEQVTAEAVRAIGYARQMQKPIVVLAGRPYHVDPEINHGIDQLIVGLGAVVVSEDALYTPGHRTPVKVLNQWTYQARLYGAAEYVVTQSDMQLIHLVSFGCGTDAITSDEVKSLLGQGNKLYTQIKIDETSNLGAAKIRIRSMFASASKEVGGK
ncbi:MAG: acyl-CoA dehydratase activase-related protein, partial [Cellulosilyticaceae bacterium]